jgi:hypothetical protein
MLPFLLAVLLWLALAGALATATSRIKDWFVMTDELLYERLAISIDRLGTPFPHVHDVAVSNINQLYPLLLAIVFRHGVVAHGFHQAHVLNAFVMTSVAIPSYLLAATVTRRRVLSLVVAAASATVVWLTLGSFLLTEVVAYPVFVWAILAMHRCLARPSAGGDVLAVAGICLAVLARTQFYLLAAVLPVAIFAQAAVERRVAASLRAHRTLVALYALGLLAALVLVASGHNLLGTYASTTSGNPFPADMLRAVPAHLAVVGLATGLLPLLIGGAWLASNLRRSEDEERFAFAWLGTLTVLALAIEVGSFDLRFGGGAVRDRYLFYIAPLLFVALAAALSASRPPRWSLGAPLAIVVVGFWEAPWSTFEKLNADSPAAVLNDWLRDNLHGLTGARWFLTLAAVVVVLLYVEATLLAGAQRVLIACSALLVLALPAETAYGFKRLFAVDGTSGLPITLDQSNVFDWIDRTVGPDRKTVMVPYPVLVGDYSANLGYWWDLEFWNRSVTQEAWRRDQFSGSPPGSFPKLEIRFDPATGRANIDPDALAVQALEETRFHIAGQSISSQRDAVLVQPDRPWRADWISEGLYNDGWTRPGQTARIRIFALPHQATTATRYVSLYLAAPQGIRDRLVTIKSSRVTWHVRVGQDVIKQEVWACVPPTGYEELRLTVHDVSPIPGDLSNLDTFGEPRDGGILVHQVAVYGETPNC